MVINRRSAGGIAAIWLAAVVGVSGTAWVAIDRAGRDITNVKVTTPPAVPVAAPTSTPEPTMMALHTPTATPRPIATTKPPARRTPTAPAVTPAPHSTPVPRPTQGSAPAPTATPQDKTIVVSGNIVSVRCTGNKIGLRIAQPDFGWRVHVETNDGRIYVTFRTGEEEDQRQAQVIAMCREGTPELAVNNR